MFNRYKNKSKVIVYGPGQNNGNFYNNIPATIIERDPYFKDYHVKFKNGTDDWILPKYLRKPYEQTRKGK